MDSQATVARRRGESPGITWPLPFAVFNVRYARLIFIAFVFVQYEVQEHTCFKRFLHIYVCILL